MFDRRQTLRLIALGAPATLIARPAAARPRTIEACVVADAASGRIIARTGAAATRFAPCSTFKLPLALMGFDAGLLTDAHHPAWPYDAARFPDARDTDRTTTDPTRWLAESVVWYSQALTQRLGMARFQRYVDAFGYGNRDLRGTPGRGDGLTRAWLSSSLQISPDEQLGFVRAMLAHRLVGEKAHAAVEAITPRFDAPGGWSVHGKTGSGWLQDARRTPRRDTPLGWFVGWAEKDGRRLAFARMIAGAAIGSGYGGPVARDRLLAEIGTIARR